MVRIMLNNMLIIRKGLRSDRYLNKSIIDQIEFNRFLIIYEEIILGKH